MKIAMVELADKNSRGSIGCHYIIEHAIKAGYSIDLLNNTKSGYDVELLSIHHCSDYLRLLKTPKRAPIRIIGGHPMQNNPLPVIRYCDAVCIGEGETWIKNALSILKLSGVVDLKELPGTIVSSLWKNGDTVPEANVENPLPQNEAYLNRPGTLSAAWYVEIARGCPFACDYCELGHSTKFRKYSYEQLCTVIDNIDTSITRKINFYAPDEASHPDYQALYDRLRKRGFMAGFASMRVDSVLKNMPPIAMNQLIRVGIDGLSEETRFKVNKKITDDMIVEYFYKLICQGHVQFKVFMMFGYPWEVVDDFKKWAKLMRRIFDLPLSKNISLRIKWTPLIPQPCTPLRNSIPKYDYEIVDKINTWHALNNRPRKNPGIYVENDGMMSEKTHKMQCELTAGNEEVLPKYVSC